MGLVSALLQLLCDGSEYEVMRIKLRLKEGVNADACAGYRDNQLVVKIPQTELLFEIQLHLRIFYEKKTQATSITDNTGRTGHQRYVEYRNVIENIGKELRSLKGGTAC